MSFFAGLDAEAYDRTYRDRDLARRMALYFRPHARALLLSVAMILIISLAGALLPILTARGVDAMATGAQGNWVILLPMAVLVLGVIIWVANWIRRRQTTRAIGDVTLTLRRDAFGAAAGHDMSFYDSMASGKVVSRITSDTTQFAEVVVLITDLVSETIEALILFVVLVTIEPRLIPWLLITMPLVLGFSILFRRLARTVTRQGFRAMASVNSLIKEAVSGILVAKNFRQESSIYQEFDRVNRQSYRINVQRGFVLALVFPVLNALAGVATAILLFVGGRYAAAGAITVGAWYLFISSLDRFWFPMLNFSAFWSQIQGGLSASERIFALIDAEPAVTQTEARPTPALRGEVIFQDVSFTYGEGAPVLQNFDLHIRPGETVALVGHTGAGKSSIARLVTRFYEFQQGHLTVDGQDIRTLDLQAYRRNLGIVSQVPFLFSGSVLDNIRYARPEASRADVEAMAYRIGDGEWLEALPQGLETQVGERGAQLSMGQRQLVSLLRVLVHRPAIFILDEATANVDPFTEYQIQQALTLILAESTSVLIAHRLSTVRAADRIIVLENGRIIEQGNHQGLLQAGGHYAELYNTYFRHQSLAYVENARQTALDRQAGAASP
jgi:ATP-binding cassette subfamily B protein